MTALLVPADMLAGVGAFVLAVIAANHLRLLVVGRRLRRRLLSPSPASSSDATILVQIPVYNEPETVEGAVAAAAALDWPRHRLAVQILDDSDDGSSAAIAAAAAEAARSGLAIDHVRRGNRDGFKAGALAAGLARSDAELVAVLDADHRPSRDFLRRAIGLLEENPAAGFAQLRFEIANRDASALTRAQGLLVDAHFLVEQAGRAAAGEWIQFNGTAGVWRRSAIEAAGGWSGATLAEDLDLALRAQALGRRGVLALMPAVACEAPASAGSWRVQQARWSKGFVGVAAALLRRAELRRPSVILLLGLQAALPAFLALVIGFAADMALRGPTAAHGVLAGLAAAAGLAILVAITLPPFLALRRGGLLAYGRDLAALPAMLLGLALANGGLVVAALLGRSEAAIFVRTPKTGRGEPRR
jgi:cellulose synthase/poly-beta-1,6-N-acetylglucosamine synthase-like glycosyltransferase